MYIKTPKFKEKLFLILAQYFLATILTKILTKCTVKLENISEK